LTAHPIVPRWTVQLELDGERESQLPSETMKRRCIAGVALAALLVFGGALAEASFVHTDDGCSLELHCLACRWVIGSTAVAAPAFVLVAHVGAGVPVSEPPEIAPAPSPVQSLASRGPPAA
jgi:hypothetical protein